MAEATIRLSYRCDYCGQFTSTRNAIVTFVYADLRHPLEDGSYLVFPGTYCSGYCARRARRVSTLRYG